MPDNFVTVPFEVDPEALNALAIDHLQEQVPGWQPTPGDLLTIALEGASFFVAELMATASDVPPAIFRALGAKLHNIPPDDASAATGNSTWTLVDDDGYVIPAGTQVGIEADTGEQVGFEVVAEVAVAQGDVATAAGEVLLVALEEGEAGSGLTNDPELVDSLSFVESIELVGVTTGGEDAETDDDYLARLSQEFEILAPRPILARDFAILARRVNGVQRAVAIDNYVPGINEVQSVSVTSASGGTFTLTFSGQTTGTIAWNASAATVQAALEALSNIAPGDVLCSGGPLMTSAVAVEFRGQYAGTNVPAMTANGASLTGGGAAVAVTTTTVGVVPETNAERAVTVAVVDETGEVVSSLIRAEVDELLQAMRELNFEVYVVDPFYSTIDVTFTAVAHEGWDAAAVEVAAEAAVADYLDPANWGRPTSGEIQFIWLNETVVRYLELADVINRVEGLHYISALTFAEQGDALATTNVTLAGEAPLTRAGTIAGTVSAP